MSKPQKSKRTITNPQKGDVVYSTSAGKYKGFVSTAASTTFKVFF